MADKKICVAMQPTYLPWLGYFDLMDQSHVFVFLDNVQFSKRSWQQRNRIRTSRGLELITVPVSVKGLYKQKIQDVQIVGAPSFAHDHICAIEYNYRRAPYFETYFSKLREILFADEVSLRNLNIRLIQWLTAEMGISTTLLLASSLGAYGTRSNLLLDICMRVGSQQYLSPIGSADYLIHDADLFSKNNLEIVFHHYDHPSYSQVFQPFIPYASVIDLLFNEGDNAAEIIRSGRRQSFGLDEAIERRRHVEFDAG